MHDSNRVAYGLIPLLNLLEDHGADVADFLASVNLPAFSITDPTYTISRDRETEIVAAAIQLVGAPYLGLKLAKRTHLNHFSVYGLAIRACRNLSEVLDLSMSYRNLAWGNCDIRQRRCDNAIVTIFDAGHSLLDRVLVERDVACAVLLMSEAFGNPIPLREVHFAFPQPADTQSYRSLFACPIKFEQPSNSIWIPSSAYDLPLPGTDPLAKAFYEAQCGTMAKALKTPFSYRETSRNRLYRTTPMPNLEQLAETLNLTPRTLQRRLKQENTLFSELVQEVRQGRAEEYLAEGELSIERIAEALGFLDAVAFSHAFKKWTGLSPSRWRQNHLGHQEAEPACGPGTTSTRQPSQDKVG